MDTPELLNWYELKVRFAVAEGTLVVENEFLFAQNVAVKLAEVVPQVKYVDQVEMTHVGEMLRSEPKP